MGVGERQLLKNRLHLLQNNNKRPDTKFGAFVFPRGGYRSQRPEVKDLFREREIGLQVCACQERSALFLGRARNKRICLADCLALIVGQAAQQAAQLEDIRPFHPTAYLAAKLAALVRMASPNLPGWARHARKRPKMTHLWLLSFEKSGQDDPEREREQASVLDELMRRQAVRLILEPS